MFTVSSIGMAAPENERQKDKAWDADSSTETSQACRFASLHVFL